GGGGGGGGGEGAGGQLEGRRARRGGLGRGGGPGRLGRRGASAAAPFSLPQPSRRTADDHAADDENEDQREQRNRERISGVRLVERIERDHDGLTIGHREGGQADRKRHQYQRRDEPAEHALRGCRSDA